MGKWLGGWLLESRTPTRTPTGVYNYGRYGLWWT